MTAGTRDRLAELGPPNRFWVVPEREVMYVPTSKNACTTMKWVLAEIAGEDTTRDHVDAPDFIDVHKVHNRSRWKRIRNLDQVPDATLDRARPDNDWFVFGVSRDPRTRLFSAWQDKMLMRNGRYLHLRHEPWFPRFPERADWVIEDFARFVEMLARNPDHRLLRNDTHFRSQTSQLRTDLVPYSRVYDVREINELYRDLIAHLSAHGGPSEVLLRRANDTPLRVNAAVFADGVKEMIEKIYAEDFDQFGDRWDFTVIEGGEAWPEATIEHAYVRASLKYKAGKLQGDVRRLRNRVTELEGRPAGAAGPDGPTPVATRLQPLERRARRLAARGRKRWRSWAQGRTGGR